MTESTAVPTPLSRRRVIPGLGLSLGITFVWLGLIVLIPLVGVFVKASGLGWSGLWNVWMEPRVLSALSVSFGAALVAAAFNAVMGTWVAWVFGRYDFPGKRVFDAIIDLPSRIADSSGRYCAGGIVWTQWMDRVLAGAGWVQDCLHSFGDRSSAGVRWSAFCGADCPAGVGRGREGVGGGCCFTRCESLADDVPCCIADAMACNVDGICVGFRARCG